MPFHVPDPEAIRQAAAHLRDGGLVAFPTETVYGLGADARNPAALARIFATKGRPSDHPLIVHLHDAAQLRDWARAVPAAVWPLVEAFWPGPLTLVLDRHADVPTAVTGGQSRVALRVPAHPFARALLAAFGGGIAAPSANRFGRISPTSAMHVREELGEDFGLILDGGCCPVGIESTIIGFESRKPVLLRPGGISRLQIEAVLGRPVASPSLGAIRVSGSLPSHYAPRTRLELWPLRPLAARAVSLSASGLRCAAVVRGDVPRPRQAAPTLDWISMPDAPAAFARELYATLRRLDAAGHDRLLMQTVPGDVGWQAVRDRLQRAAVPAAEEIEEEWRARQESNLRPTA